MMQPGASHHESKMPIQINYPGLCVGVWLAIHILHSVVLGISHIIVCGSGVS